MKKKDILVAARKGWPDIENIVNSIFKEMNKSLIDRHDITINNFGKFIVIRSNVKKVQDFKTNTRVLAKPKYKVKFVLSPSISKLLNKEGVDNAS